VRQFPDFKSPILRQNIFAIFVKPHQNLTSGALAFCAGVLGFYPPAQKIHPHLRIRHFFGINGLSGLSIRLKFVNGFPVFVHFRLSVDKAFWFLKIHFSPPPFSASSGVAAATYPPPSTAYE
jgi:uncharacterized membrane protein YesL